MDWREGITIIRDPDDVSNWKFDFASLTNGTGESNFLASGDTISSHTITIATSSSPGLTADSSSISDTNTSVTVWLSGGVAGQTDTVTCHIVTANGVEIDRSVKFYNQSN